MNVTRKQAAEILGVSISAVERLEKQGKITPTNAQREGTKKFYRTYDATAVRTLKKELGHQYRQSGNSKSVRVVKQADDAQLAIVLDFARLEEDKRQVLVKLGERYSIADLEAMLTL